MNSHTPHQDRFLFFPFSVVENVKIVKISNSNVVVAPDVVARIIKSPCICLWQHQQWILLLGLPRRREIHFDLNGR